MWSPSRSGSLISHPVAEAAWIGLPNISAPRFDVGAIALVAPVAIVVVIEHIGHLLAVGEIVGKDYRDMLPAFARR